MPVQRTTVVLPPPLKREAQTLARELGISFARLVRNALQEEIARHRRKHKGYDPFFDDAAVYRGRVPKNYSRDHDRFLYDER